MDFKVVEKKQDFISSISNTRFATISLLVLFPILLFLMWLSEDGKLILLAIFTALTISLKMISLKRYSINKGRDYEVIGRFSFSKSVFKIDGEIINPKTIRFLYGGLRGQSYDGKDISDGISEFNIDGIRLQILLENSAQVESLKNSFNYLYENGFDLKEKDIRTDFTLLKLSKDFEWVELEKIKSKANS
jgi:hypothetical protein